MDLKQIFELCKNNAIQMVDLKFIDMPGTWQHFSIPKRVMDETLFSKGVGFDGSSIRGFKQIHESDMVLIPGSRHILY